MSAIAVDEGLAAADPSGGFPALWDWRRQVADLYGSVRAEPEPQRAWALWRAGRDRLFAQHSQTPLEDGARRDFATLPFFPYDEALRFELDLEPIGNAPMIDLPAGHDGDVRMQPFARTVGLADPLGRELTLFWITGYGGGVFVPFADATSGQETYGAGRYLLDTIKGADLGAGPSGRLILDFNFAYNPSCSYSPRYVCPLAPRVNHLPAAVRAGEMAPALGEMAPALGEMAPAQ